VKPEGWEIGAISDFSEVNPRRPKTLAALPDGHQVTFVPMAAVDRLSGTIMAGESRRFSEVRKGFTYFAEGDVIFAKITPCMQNGKAAVATGLHNELGFGSTEFHVLRPKEARVLPEWLWYFVRQIGFRREAQANFRGSAGQQRVPASFIEGHDIPVPPLAEQHRIIARVKAMMDRIDEAHELRVKASAETAVVFPAVLAGRFDSVSAHSPIVKIDDVTTQSRYGTSKKCTTKGGGTGVLRIPNVVQGVINADNLKFCKLTDKELQRLRLEDGDLLIVRTNGSPTLVGRCAVYSSCGEPVAFASYLIRIRVDQRRVDPQYLSFYLESARGRDAIAAIRRTSAGQYNVNSANLRAIEFPCPPVEKQRAMAEQMREQRKVCKGIESGIQERLKDIEPLRASILHKAFAGEL